MRMKKLRQIIAACMTGCVLLAGCGSTATEGTQQSSKLPQLVIGSDSYEPFNYINEDGEFAGVDVERRRHAAASDTSRSLHRSCGRTRTNIWRKEAWIVCGVASR